MNAKLPIMVALLVLIAAPFAAAQEAAEPTADNIEAVDSELVAGTGGVAPNSVLYGLDVALDRITLILTFDRAEKAKKGLQVARERLLEAKTMAEQGLATEAETAANEYEATLDTVAADAEAIADDGTEVVATDAVGDSVEIEDQAADVEEVAEIAKERVRARLVAQGLSEEQLAHLQAVFERIEAHVQEVKERIAQKKERALLKLRALKDASEEEAAADLDGIEASTGIKEKKQKRAMREIARARKELKSAGDELADVEDASDVASDVSDTETVVADAEALVDDDTDGAKEIAGDAKEYGQKIREIAKRLREAKSEGNFGELKQQLLEEAKARHIAVLERVLAKVPEEAKVAISTVLERARERLTREPATEPAAEPAENEDGSDESDSGETEEVEPEISSDRIVVPNVYSGQQAPGN